MRDLEEARAEQAAVADILAAISRSDTDLEAVLALLIRSAISLCGGERGVIWIRRGERLHLAAHVGYPGDWVDMVRANSIVPDPEARTVTGRVAATGEVMNVSDLPNDPRFSAYAGHRIGDYRGSLSAPLLRDGVVVGVLGLTRPDPGLFTERQVERLRRFAGQAVVAVENASLVRALNERTRDLQRSLDDLRLAQDRLVQTEKLASLGQLTAGIAHEIKNPLNFVNNFSALSADLVDELIEVLEPAGLDASLRAQVDEIAELLKGNLEKVTSHGRRADSIVRNMLDHSRSSGGEARRISVNALVDESLGLAYHGVRAEQQGFNVILRKAFDAAAGEATIQPQEITRVLLNIFANGFYAVRKRSEAGETGYEPCLTVTTRGTSDAVEIRIHDNGTGMPDHVKASLFTPFFTTKPPGEGTGLGLSLSHDIVVKQHRGSIDVVSKPGSFTEFTIVLPRHGTTAS